MLDRFPSAAVINGFKNRVLEEEVKRLFLFALKEELAVIPFVDVFEKTFEDDRDGDF